MEKRQAFQSKTQITKYEKKFKMTDQKINVWKNFPYSLSCTDGIRQGVKCFRLFFTSYFSFFLTYLFLLFAKIIKTVFL